MSVGEEVAQRAAGGRAEVLAGGPEGSPDAPYGLGGPQVEPGAAHWLLGKHLPAVVPLAEITAHFRAPSGEFREDIFFPCDVAGELAELKLLAGRRGEPLPADYLSDLIVHGRRPEQRTVRTGGELARLFDALTPGRMHRHVLDRLLAGRSDVSPVRQARLYMALDLTIYTALAAAWHFKWAAGERISLRLRPYEHDRGRTFTVLLDAAEPAGRGAYDRAGWPDGAKARSGPTPSPGTPRHPSYPSGHSTYAAAASRVLEYFFSHETLSVDDRRLAGRVAAHGRSATPDAVAYGLRQLAGNIGEARLWAGVNWRSDHRFGQQLGCVVADRVIAALRRDRIAPLGAELDTPPAGHNLGALRRMRFESATPVVEHDCIGLAEQAAP